MLGDLDGSSSLGGHSQWGRGSCSSDSRHAGRPNVSVGPSGSDFAQPQPISRHPRPALNAELIRTEPQKKLLWGNGGDSVAEPIRRRGSAHQSQSVRKPLIANDRPMTVDVIPNPPVNEEWRRRSVRPRTTQLTVKATSSSSEIGQPALPMSGAATHLLAASTTSITSSQYTDHGTSECDTCSNGVQREELDRLRHEMRVLQDSLSNLRLAVVAHKQFEMDAALSRDVAVSTVEDGGFSNGGDSSPADDAPRMNRASVHFGPFGSGNADIPEIGAVPLGNPVEGPLRPRVQSLLGPPDQQKYSLGQSPEPPHDPKPQMQSKQSGSAAGCPESATVGHAGQPPLRTTALGNPWEIPDSQPRQSKEGLPQGLPPLPVNGALKPAVTDASLVPAAVCRDNFEGGPTQSNLAGGVGSAVEPSGTTAPRGDGCMTEVVTSELRAALAETRRQLTAQTILGFKQQMVLKSLLKRIEGNEKAGNPGVGNSGVRAQGSVHVDAANDGVTFSANVGYNANLYLQALLQEKEQTEGSLREELTRLKQQNVLLAAKVRKAFLLRGTTRLSPSQEDFLAMKGSLADATDFIAALQRQLHAKTMECEAIQNEVELLRKFVGTMEKRTKDEALTPSTICSCAGDSTMTSENQSTWSVATANPTAGDHAAGSDLASQLLDQNARPNKSPKSTTAAVEAGGRKDVENSGNGEKPAALPAAGLPSLSSSPPKFSVTMSRAPQANAASLPVEPSDKQSPLRLPPRPRNAEELEAAIRRPRSRISQAGSKRKVDRTTRAEGGPRKTKRAASQTDDHGLKLMKEEPTEGPSRDSALLGQKRGSKKSASPVKKGQKRALSSQPEELEFSVLPINVETKYVPIAGDLIDEAIAAFTNSRENKILFTRVQQGFYLFGRLPISLHMTHRGSIVVAHDGRSSSLAGFVERFEDEEFAILDATGGGPATGDPHASRCPSTAVESDAIATSQGMPFDTFAPKAQARTGIGDGVEEGRVEGALCHDSVLFRREAATTLPIHKVNDGQPDPKFPQSSDALPDHRGRHAVSRPRRPPREHRGDESSDPSTPQNCRRDTVAGKPASRAKSGQSKQNERGSRVHSSAGALDRTQGANSHCNLETSANKPRAKLAGGMGRTGRRSGSARPRGYNADVQQSFQIDGSPGGLQSSSPEIYFDAVAIRQREGRLHSFDAEEFDRKGCRTGGVDGSVRPVTLSHIGEVRALRVKTAGFRIGDCQSRRRCSKESPTATNLNAGLLDTECSNPAEAPRQNEGIVAPMSLDSTGMYLDRSSPEGAATEFILGLRRRQKAGPTLNWTSSNDSEAWREGGRIAGRKKPIAKSRGLTRMADVPDRRSTQPVFSGGRAGGNKLSQPASHLPLASPISGPRKTPPVSCQLSQPVITRHLLVDERGSAPLGMTNFQGGSAGLQRTIPIPVTTSSPVHSPKSRTATSLAVRNPPVDIHGLSPISRSELSIGEALGPSLSFHHGRLVRPTYHPVSRAVSHPAQEIRRGSDRPDSQFASGPPRTAIASMPTVQSMPSGSAPIPITSKPYAAPVPTFVHWSNGQVTSVRNVATRAGNPTELSAVTSVPPCLPTTLVGTGFSAFGP